MSVSNRLRFTGDDGVVASQLLTTKLYIPQARALVARPRLVERLREGMGRKLTLICAPAGFGKTTLLSERDIWDGRSVAWVSLDEGDNDPARFLSYLIAALQTVEEGVGESALALLNSPQPPVEAALTNLINELAAIPDEFALALDDYHVITANPIHEAVAFLLDHQPPSLHLIIASRTDSPLLLARLRAQGQMTELRAADLRFTPEETATFLNEVMGLDLPVEDVAALEERTEGWIAGLQLAALSMRGRDDVSDFIEAFTGSHRYVLAYLTEEVLQRQPEGLQSFLLQTSILDRLIAPLCDAVTGRSDGLAMLEKLEQDNLFVVPLDEERRWYRYHHLFSEFLRGRLYREQAGSVPDLHRRAFEWCRRNGMTSEAVNHALATGDFERAAQEVERMGHGTFMRGGMMATTLGWMEALPSDVVRSQPQLCLFRAWAHLFAGQLDTVEPWLQDAERELGAKEETGSILGEVAACRAYQARLQGDVPRTVELSRRALRVLPEDDPVLRGVTLLNLGIAHRMSGDVEAAGRILVEAEEVNREAGNIHPTLVAVCNLALLEMVRGKLHESARDYRRALRLATEWGAQRLPSAGLAHIGMGKLLGEWNDLEAAEHRLTEGIELSRAGGIAEILLDGYVALAQARNARGDLAGALEAIREAERLLERVRVPRLTARVSAYRAQLWMTWGDSEAVDGWVRECGFGVDDEPDYLQEVEHLTLARALIFQGRYDRAARFLERLLGAAEDGAWMASVIEILILQALALRAQGETEGAMKKLGRALALAEPEGYVRTFVDEGEPMSELLHRAASLGIAWDYASKLLVAFDGGAALLAAVEATKDTGALSEPLTERELEVLRLIAGGKSNRGIAQGLFVAVSTVKKHINNIYRKLEAHSRTQAVARARELNLL